jgi:hypothetical protein
MMMHLFAPRLVWLAFRRGPSSFWRYLEIVLRLWFLQRRWRFPRAPWHRCGPKGCGYDPMAWPGDYYDRLAEERQAAQNPPQPPK